MSEFEKSWIESERHRHQRLLWELRQEFQSSPQTPVPHTPAAETRSSIVPSAAPVPACKENRAIVAAESLKVNSVLLRLLLLRLPRCLVVSERLPIFSLHIVDVNLLGCPGSFRF